MKPVAGIMMEFIGMIEDWRGGGDGYCDLTC